MSGTFLHPPLFSLPDHRVDAWLFDLDGTLLDTLDDLADSINAMLADRRLPLRTREEVRAGVGDGMWRLVERMLPDDRRDSATVREALEDYRAAYRERWHLRTRPYPGIAEELLQLTQAGTPLGVVSNKPQDFTARMIGHFFPSPKFRFGVVFGEREGVPRKPDPAALLEAAGVLAVPPSRCAYVGDSPGDITAATAAGMVAVGVDWGFREAQMLREAGAEVVLSLGATADP